MEMMSGRDEIMVRPHGPKLWNLIVTTAVLMMSPKMSSSLYHRAYEGKPIQIIRC